MKITIRIKTKGKTDWVDFLICLLLDCWPNQPQIRKQHLQLRRRWRTITSAYWAKAWLSRIFYHVSVAWERCTSAHLGKILRDKWMMCYSEDSEEAMDDVLSRARDDWDSNDLEHQWAIIGGEALLSAESFSQICSDQSRNGITHWQLELLVKLNEKESINNQSLLSIWETGLVVYRIENKPIHSPASQLYVFHWLGACGSRSTKPLGQAWVFLSPWLGCSSWSCVQISLDLRFTCIYLLSQSF